MPTIHLERKTSSIHTMAEKIVKTTALVNSYAAHAPKKLLKVRMGQYTYNDMVIEQIDALVKYVRQLAQDRLWIWEWTCE